MALGPPAMGEERVWGWFYGLPLDLRLHSNRVRELIGHPLTYYPAGSEGIEVPVGFTFDGASIPRPAWSLIGHPLDSRYLPAAIVHDWGYRTQRLSRADTDRLFYEGLRACRVEPGRARLMYLAVRAAGRYR